MTDWYNEATLPRFERPPVSETAIALEYPSIIGMDYYRLTRLQSAWEERYPQISDAPGAPPTPAKSDGQIMFAFGEPPKRIWASAESNGLLVQTQTDRLILNWRRDFSDTPYPGYLGSLRSEYLRLWAEQLDFLASSGLPAPLPSLAEFTYINLVPLETSDRLSDVVTVVRTPEKELPGRDSFGRFQFIRDIAPSDEHPFAAQIHIAGEPVQPQPDSRQLAFTITARVIVGESSPDPIVAVDAAHALASQTFARIITDDRQEQWGRIQ